MNILISNIVFSLIIFALVAFRTANVDPNRMVSYKSGIRILKVTSKVARLMRALWKIENGEYEKAVMSITKIIENILKDKFAKDENFQKHLIM